MSALTGLVTHFTDGNVTLGVLLGAISALSTLRALLPEPAVHASSTRRQARRERRRTVCGAVARRDRNA